MKYVGAKIACNTQHDSGQVEIVRGGMSRMGVEQRTDEVSKGGREEAMAAN